MLRLGVLTAMTMSLAACTLDARGLGGARARDTGVVVRDTAIDELDTALTVEDAIVEEDTAVEETRDAGPIFDAPSPLPGCTVGFRLGHEYLFCENEANWDQARTTCQIAGYDLVILNDRAEQDFVVGHLKTKAKNNFHIGLTDRASEGTFVWVDGTKPSFTSWASWQPDNWLFAEDCVDIRRDGTWNDMNCTDGNKEGFVCETL